jgi:glycosyltransferase involved in cell wall biosynthesis
MKLAILSNHSYPMTGGSEKVVKQISDSMRNDFNVHVDVFSRNVINKLTENNVNYYPLPFNFPDFHAKLNKNQYDHILIYGDLFFHTQKFIENIDTILGKKSIVLVGANNCLKNYKISSLLKKNCNKIRVVTHSNNYSDSQACRDWNIPFKVIHNSVDFREFNKKSDFRKKFNFKEEDNLILTVSNFFPGKGHEYLPEIAKRVNNKLKFIIVHSTINYDLVINTENKLKENIERFYNHLDFTFLKDLKRDDVLSSFMSCDLFLFPSRKEVSPLVLLESMAAKLPWLSCPVGNSTDLKGGLIIHPRGNSMDGCIFSDDTFKSFAEKLDYLIENKDIRKRMGEEARLQVENEYNWENIKHQYYDLIKEEKNG